MPIPAGFPAPTGGVCAPWVDAITVGARHDMAEVTIDPDELNRACLDASTLLYGLSGRQFPGACTATVRPVGYPYGCSHVTALRDGLASGRMTLDSWTAATNGGMCGDAGLDLQLYPVRDVIQVKINGLVVPDTQYRVDGNRWLVRPGVLFWPLNQRLDLPDTADGTFSVTVAYGADPPPHGVRAASKLAAEIAKDAVGEKSALPRRITSITRQGVSISNADPMQFLSKGLLGIWECDSFLTDVNPARQFAPSLIWSPELDRRRRV